MTDSLLTTKLFIPSTRPNLVPRPHLVEQVNEGLHRKMTLISAPAGFGKTTLLSEWVDKLRLDAKKENRIAWLSLDGADNDSARFLSYIIASLNQTEGIESAFGRGALSMLQSPQSPPTEVILTSLINEFADITDKYILVLDDYHLIEAQPIHDALTFLLEHLPSQMHLVFATREDPHLPLSRLRASGQLTDLRAADLRFTSSETAEFLNKVTNLYLSAEDITALETRTEGWIAGLQLAAISMQGLEAPTKFINSFTGSHRLVLDYLIEEVLDKQPENIQTFLLQTAILNRLSGSLCDALTGQDKGQQNLEYLEHANLFIVPLDNERRWYRYHHLFADLLRQRLHQSASSSKEEERKGVAELHKRASLWFEDNGLEIEAFQHAVSANDVERAARLMEGERMPLHYRGAVAPVLNWLKSLPPTVLDAKPSLWVNYASALVFTGQSPDAEQKLQAAEEVLQGVESDDKTQDLVGHIAAIRAMLALRQRQIENIIVQSRRALEFLHPDNLPVRTAATWTLGMAYQFQGDRDAARRAYTETISICQASGNIFINIMASTGLGIIQEEDNQLHLAAETFRSCLLLAGDPPQPAACEPYLGLARIYYQWNDLDAAQQHGQQCILLLRQLGNVSSFVGYWMFLTHLKLAQGDVESAASILVEADQFVRDNNYVHRVPEVAAAHVHTLLHQGKIAAAADLAEKHELPVSQARVHLAQGDPSAALAVLEPWHKQVETKGLEDERLKVMLLEAVALHAHDEKDRAMQLLGDALALAEPGGFIRIFVDEGPPMARLLHEALSREIAPNYVRLLLAAFPDTEAKQAFSSQTQVPKSELVEPLSGRELEILTLIAAGLKNKEIAEQLFISLNTVLYHIKNIYSKLGVNKRTLAITKARKLNLLPNEQSPGSS